MEHIPFDLGELECKDPEIQRLYKEVIEEEEEKGSKAIESFVLEMARKDAVIAELREKLAQCKCGAKCEDETRNYN